MIQGKLLWKWSLKSLRCVMVLHLSPSWLGLCVSLSLTLSLSLFSLPLLPSLSLSPTSSPSFERQYPGSTPTIAVCWDPKHPVSGSRHHSLPRASACVPGPCGAMQTPTGTHPTSPPLSRRERSGFTPNRPSLQHYIMSGTQLPKSQTHISSKSTVGLLAGSYDETQIQVSFPLCK
jgi:hypothetical protein